MTRIFTFLFAFISTISVVKAQSFTCNNALVGYNYVVDNVNNGLLGLLTGGTSFNNVLDTNLNNYAQINMTAVALGGRVAAVKRVNGSFPSGKKAGFVIEIPGTAVTLELLDGLSIRTYLNNTVQETVSLGGGSGLLKLSLLNAGAEGLRRIEFTTTKAFDEIELIKSSAVAALTSIRIYYSYVSDASCDNDCITTLTTNNYASATANTNTIGGFSSPGNVTDILTGNFASRTFLALGSAYIDINAGQDIPAGSDVGFIVEQVGLLGILSLDVLSNITITTYNSAGVGQDTMVANANLADVGLLANGLTSIGFKTKKAFRRVRINFSIPLSLLGTYRVYYGFVRLDNDNDGVPNCLDNCSGDDLIVNSKGEPLDCYEQCYINAGPDISKCPADSTNSVQLAAAGSGNTWEALPGNPSPATINQSGQVQGMAAHGIYRFRLYNSTCSDTISVNYNISNLDPSCNRALTAPNAVIDIQSPFGGICLLCSSGGVSNIVDGNLNNYAEYNQLLGLLSSTSLIAVRDTNNVYPSGTRTGFVVSFPDGLLNASALSAFQLRTYRNGVLAETATTSNGLLGAGVLPGAGNKTRISFVATQPFDKVELIAGNVLGLLTTIRVHNAFVEPSSCPSNSDVATAPQTACFEVLTADSDNFATINYNRTGFTGAACALCNLDSLSYIVDNSSTNYATLTLTAGVLVQGAVSVRSKKTFTSGYEAGFAVSADASLLTVDVLSNISIVTFLNGVRQDSISSNSPLLSASLLPGAQSVGFVGFRSTKPFNEVKLNVTAPLSANLLSSGLKVYYAYARLDSDGDGIPDCQEKCCAGDDNTDNDGDGVPDDCDANILAHNDTVTVIENSPANINVLSNDTYGLHALDTLRINQQPAHGTASVNDNGTPGDPTDDYIHYVPDSNFIGSDTLSYVICDIYFTCSEAYVYVNVVAALKAVNDTATLNEDTPATVYPINNDTFGPEGPGTTPVTIVTPPANGTATVNDNGTPNDPTDDFIQYTPDNNYNGTDSLDYQICDASSNCVTGTIYFNIEAVNDAPVAVNDTVTVNMNTPAIVNVLANDNDDADTPDGGLDLSSLTVITQPTNGTISVDTSTGEITYTPDPGFSGTDSLVYQICDLGEPSPPACSQATVYFNVRQTPVANNDPVNINEDTPVNVDVLDNDSFGFYGPGTTPVTIVTPPAHGTATVNDNGTPNDPTDDFIQYAPDNNYNGTDSLVYQICDASSNCATGIVYFNINAVNDAPVAVNDTATVNMNTPAIVNVLANDNDDADAPDGGLDFSSLTVTTQPANGTVSVNTATGEITYTSDPGFSGTDSLVYQICDLGEPSPSACSQATVYFNVRQTPVANNDPVNINEDTPVNVDVLDNDSFGFYGPGTTPVTIVTPPAHGTATVNDNGTPNDPTDDFIQYTPDNNYKGTDSLVYQICDASSNCATGIVYFNINAVNDAPVANDDSGTVPSGGSVTVNVLANDNDDADAPDGGIDFNSLTIISQPYNGSAVANTFNGTITYTADPGYYGNDTIIYSICDLGHPLPSLCDTARLIIRAGIPDLSPNILILPSIVHGASSFSIIVEAHEINNAPTDGSEIVLIMARDPYIQFNYNPALSNLIFFNVHNNKWTYDGSDPLFHIFRTNEVIPPGGFLSFGLEASFDPQGASGQKPLTISIYQGGGEMNLNNNTDAEMLIFFGN